ncbi:MAG: nitroreductase family protein [Hydrogenophaga sp.]|nr:nitroreductase family protein [Hydrogenophaga sp.]
MGQITLDLQSDLFVLPAPVVAPHLSLADALRERRSVRAFSAEAVSAEVLSALLWAAFGINRPSTGQRTAPSAHNWQEIELFVVLAQGSYVFDAHNHRLNLVKAEDLRVSTGTQDFVGEAPVNLVYVANFDRMTGTTVEERPFLAGADAGCIAQNVYLYCSGMGLATVVRGLVDRRQLARKLGLRPSQRIALAQTVGWPAH